MITDSSTIRSANDPTIAGTSVTAPGPALQELIESEWRQLGQADLVRSLQRHPILLRDRSLLMNLAVEEFRVRRTVADINDLPQYCERFREFGGSVERSILRQLEAQRYVDDNFTELFAQPSWPTIGEAFGAFDVLEELGRGSLARVYLCLQRDLGNRPVVLKTALHSDIEASILGRLNHPHITPVFSTGFVEEFGLHYICMPYVGRSTLADLIDVAFAAGLPRRDEPVQSAATRWNCDEVSPLERRMPYFHRKLRRGTYVDSIIHLATQIAGALDHGHRQGVLHGDLKPSNVLLTPDGSALLLDYNLSQDFAGSLRRCGGTLPYMPPEHLKVIVQPEPPRRDSGFNAASDIYSFGALLYELLTGRPPVIVPEHDSDLTRVAQLFLNELRHGPPHIRLINPLASRRLESIVLDCLSFDAGDRPTSMSVIQRRLQADTRLLASVIRGARVHPLAFSAVVAVPVGLTFGAAGYFALRQPVHVVAYELGLIFAAAGRFEDAALSFNNSLEAEPSFDAARLQRARVNLWLDELDLAMADFVHLAREGHAPCMAYLGYCFNLKGADVAAIPWYERAIEQGAGSMPVFNNLGASYLATKTHVSHSEQIRRAERYLLKAESLDQGSVTIQLNIVRLATLKSRFDRSYDPFSVWRNATDVLARRPHDALIRNHLDEWYRNVLQREAGFGQGSLGGHRPSEAERAARQSFDRLQHAAASVRNASLLPPPMDPVSSADNGPAGVNHFFLEPN
jgi:serine/threonine protein kinase